MLIIIWVLFFRRFAKGEIALTGSLSYEYLRSQKTYYQLIIFEVRFNLMTMTQNDLANKVGVTRQTIVAIEKAKVLSDRGMAFLIARVFN